METARWQFVDKAFGGAPHPRQWLQRRSNILGQSGLSGAFVALLRTSDVSSLTPRMDSAKRAGLWGRAAESNGGVERLPSSIFPQPEGGQLVADRE